nr:T9SS type A sorting domain-containing protein [Bacteroidota bacterium]
MTGTHPFTWYVKDVQRGMYLLKMESDGLIYTRKLIVNE